MRPGTFDADHQHFIAEALPLREDLMRVARRYTTNIHDAEDLVQDTIIKAWLGFGSRTSDANLRAWLVRIMVNTWIDNHRKTRSRPREVLAGSVSDADVPVERQMRMQAPSAEDMAMARMPDDQLTAGMRTLPAPLQVALYYAEVCQFPLRRIAEMERVPVGTVMSRLHRARRRLRSALLGAAVPSATSCGKVAEAPDAISPGGR
jgi:RNA polymerase sigma-70 factor, ECF subfamily